MPDKKISELNTSGALTGNEEIPLVQSGTTFKTLLNTIKNFVTSTFNLQNVTDNGNTTTNKITVDAVNFSQTPTNSPAAGQVAYNGSTGALAYLMNNSNVMSNIGQTLHAYVNNADSVKITKGQPVYLFSASGNKASVKLAYNTSDATSAKTFGLAAEDIDVNQNGFIICQGVIDKLNTGSYTDGDTLYLGASAGTLTNIKPYAPNHLVYIGIVERANNGNGQIYVKVQNGYELDEIHDIDLKTTPPSDKDVLQYESSSQLWKNKSILNVLVWTFFPSPFNPADATTYYFSRIVPNTTASNHGFKFPYNGIVKSATFMIGNNVISGSTETSIINFRNITQSKSSLITNTLTTNGSTTAIISQTISGLNISFLSTDSVCFEWITPTWSTNPTSVGISIYLEVEYIS